MSNTTSNRSSHFRIQVSNQLVKRRFDLDSRSHTTRAVRRTRSVIQSEFTISSDSRHEFKRRLDLNTSYTARAFADLDE